MVVARDWGRLRMRSCYLVDIEFQFYKKERILVIGCVTLSMNLTILNRTFKMVKTVNFILYIMHITQLKKLKTLNPIILIVNANLFYYHFSIHLLNNVSQYAENSTCVVQVWLYVWYIYRCKTESIETKYKMNECLHLNY